MIVLKKLVKPSVRKAPAGAFRYIQRYFWKDLEMNKPFKSSNKWAFLKIGYQLYGLYHNIKNNICHSAQNHCQYRIYFEFSKQYQCNSKEENHGNAYILTDKSDSPI